MSDIASLHNPWCKTTVSITVPDSFNTLILTISKTSSATRSSYLPWLSSVGRIDRRRRKPLLGVSTRASAVGQAGWWGWTQVMGKSYSGWMYHTVCRASTPARRIKRLPSSSNWQAFYDDKSDAWETSFQRLHNMCEAYPIHAHL